MSVGIFIGGLLMLFIGLIGEYMSKIYLEIKHRPIYIEKEKRLQPICMGNSPHSTISALFLSLLPCSLLC